MSHFAMHQNSFVKCEETRITFSSSLSDQNIPVVCPKPRRAGRLVGVEPIRPITMVNFSHPLDVCDSSDGDDVLEMLLAQECYGDEDLQWEDRHGMSPPPLFYGSPPSRSANPIIHDVRFLEEKASTPLTPLSLLSSSSSPSGGRNGGLFRSSSFGPLPAAVRIEGFDCLDQDRRGRSIPAFA